MSSARAVRCRLKCHNERNPRVQLPAIRVGHSGRTAGASREEGGDDVKSARPLRPGRHTCYNGVEQREATWRQGAEPENTSQFGLESATRLHEAGFASNRASAMARGIRSRALYTPPVKPWEPVVPEGRNRKERSRVRLVTGAKS